MEKTKRKYMYPDFLYAKIQERKKSERNTTKFKNGR